MRRADVAELCDDIRGLAERGGDVARHAARVLDTVRAILENFARENDDLRHRLEILERGHLEARDT